MVAGDLDLSQLADGIPDVLRHVHKYRILSSPPDLALNLPSPLLDLDQVSEVELASEFSDFFDWDLYGGKQTQRPRSAGKSDVSMPGLTSATSEGSASTNSDPEDRSQLKAKVREAKKGDDKLTLPQLKPKGGTTYQQIIQLEDAGHGSSTMPQAARTPTRDAALPSPPTSRESSVNRSLLAAHHSSTRGKRQGPLKNPDDVAQVRDLGACLRCQYRKVKCDQKVICSKCFDNTAGSGSDITLPADQQMCFRKLFADGKFVFPVIAKTETGRPSTGSRSRNQRGLQQLQVCFGTMAPRGPSLMLPVVLRESAITNSLPSSQHHDDVYMLDLDQINICLSEERLCEWARGWNINTGAEDFQASLDALMDMCAGYGASCFPSKQLGVLQKVHRMRCLFKVWSQRNFFIVGESTYRKLPPTLQSGLRQIAKSAMKRLEEDICKSLAKSLDPKWTKPAERLPIWISMMQMIMMYRELYNRTESAPNHRPGVRPPSSWEYVLYLTKDLFSTMVYMCEVCFGKKQPEPLNLDGHQQHQRNLQKEVNARFGTVIDCRGVFYDGLKPHPGSLDQIIYVRLAAVARSVGAKRQKSSKQRQK